MTIFIGGNSHIGALRGAIETKLISLEQVTFMPFGAGGNLNKPFCDMEDGKLRLTIPRALESFESVTGKDYFSPSDRWVLLIANPIAIIRSTFWDKCAPSTTCTKRLRPVPIDVVKAMFHSHYAPKFDFYSKMRDAGVDVTAMSYPPLRRDHPMFSRRHRLSFKSALELDRIGREMHQEFLNASGIPLITPPAETIDRDGFLLSQFEVKVNSQGRRDKHHASAEYGAIMLHKLVDEMGL